MHACRYRLLFVLALASLAWVPSVEAGTPLNSSVLVFDQAMLQTASDRVARAARLPNRRLQLVVTVHCRLDADLEPIEFGMLHDRQRGEDTPGNFVPATEQLCSTIVSHVADAFAAAKQHKTKLSVLLHLDAVGPKSVWRNEIRLNPLKPQAGFSFDSLAITPVVEAARRAGVPLELSLAGEMGTSVFLHAPQYGQIISRVKAKTPQARLGVSLNFSDVDNGLLESSAEQSSLSNGSARADAVTKLLANCDFLGVSLYAPLSEPPTARHFASSIARFRQELAGLGVRVPAGLPLRISEVALGGGNGKPDFSASQAMREPWEGVGSGTANPWTRYSLRQLRRQYHKALLTFLRNPPPTAGGEGPLEAAFLWSEGSWDPQGLLNGRYRDRLITAAIRLHNAQVAMAATAKASADAAP